MMKRWDFRSKWNRFLNSGAFYGVLVLCLCTLAVCAYILTRSSAQQNKSITITPTPQISSLDNELSQSESQPETESVEIVQEELPAQVPTDAAQPQEQELQAASATVTPEEQLEQEAQATSAPTTFVLPLSGTLGLPFSVDQLVYSNTMKDWRTHQGVDLRGAVGTPVKAMAAGTVTEIFEDDMMGCSIRIDHGGGLCSVYQNLSPSHTVVEGQKVIAGQVISGVGESAVAEADEAPHVHVEVLLNGIPQNPLDYFSLPD